MIYKIKISDDAEKQIGKLNPRMGTRIRDAIRKLAPNPRASGTIKLKGREEWRIRVGDFRVIYTIHDDTVLVFVVKVAHRGDAYRNL